MIINGNLLGLMRKSCNKERLRKDPCVVFQRDLVHVW